MFCLTIYNWDSRSTAKRTTWLLIWQRLRLACAPTHSQFYQSLLSVWRSIGTLITHRAHSKDWSGYADAQADLSLRCAHIPRFTFSCALAQLNVVRPRGNKTWVYSLTQNKAQWLAACGHVSAISQSLRFILSLRLYSSSITSRAGIWKESTLESLLFQSTFSDILAQ